MSRDREASAQVPGNLPPAPWTTPLLPITLLLLAGLAALLAAQQPWGAALNALAMLLIFSGALLAGAFWARQRQLDRLREARIGHQLLSQLLDVWCWQTDAEHRLVKLQPPQGAPASAWVAGAFSGEFIWQRFQDQDDSLRPRLQAQAPLGDLRVLRVGPDGQPGRAWQLRGLPRFDGRGRFAGFLGVAWPTAAADALRTAQLGLDALLDHGPAALCLAMPAADAQGWVLTRANPAALALLDQTSLPTDGLPWAAALARLPGPLARQVATLQPGQGCQAEGWALRLEALDATGNGQRPALLLSMGPTSPASAAPNPALIEAAQQAAGQAAAEQAAFSYTISHDLRAPIRVIEGFGRILKEDYAAALDRVGRDHLDRVMAAAARMNHMIDALLSLSRLSTQPLSRQPVNLSQLAAFVIDDLRRSAPERTATVEIEPDLVTEGDPTLLRMVLENLLGNAWKYSAKVARARIVVGRVPNAKPGERTVYQVRDNGAGFDMRFADRLFGVFQRLHSSSDFPGHGVGLASVRRIVRRHGGEIWAEGEVGVGATFSFTLKA